MNEKTAKKLWDWLVAHPEMGMVLVLLHAGILQHWFVFAKVQGLMDLAMALDQLERKGWVQGKRGQVTLTKAGERVAEALLAMPEVIKRLPLSELAKGE